ncbi:hypothetical protein E2C01_037375 [Portunus trituberculatus]|uniref:Uncharacterized protein n=1 Tax=Portunus trituberculatus TaxID=210409 RepID=A0A5B7FF55_PORTR|nr:hypothetical protein [Portunus trituberculatus]
MIQVRRNGTPGAIRGEDKGLRRMADLKPSFTPVTHKAVRWNRACGVSRVLQHHGTDTFMRSWSLSYQSI